MTWVSAVPPVPVAVKVKVVVVVGETEVAPETGTTPIPEIDTVVALVEVQLRIALPPLTIEVGETEAVMVGGGSVTVRVTEAVAVPPGPVAVKV